MPAEQPPANFAPPGRCRALPAVAGAGLALGLFLVTLGGTYIYDDLDIVLNDKRMHDASRWGEFWLRSYNDNADKLYRPLVSMTYAIQWAIHGDRAWAFHLINVLLHAGVTACFGEFVRRMTDSRVALIAALLFAAHPVHVEAVANIVGRAELLCALGMFGALTMFARQLTLGSVLGITGCFLLALLSKEQGMLIPLLIGLFALARRRLDPPGLVEPSPRPMVKLLVLLLCWTLAGYIVWRENILGFSWERIFLDWTLNPMVASAWNPHGGSVGADRWLMPLALLGRYTALLVAPFKLSPEYGGHVIGWSVSLDDPYLYLGITAVIGWFVCFAIALRKRSAIAVFALLGLGLTYGMIGNIVAIIGTNFAERLMYIPSAFFLILVAIVIARLPRPAMIGVTAVALTLACIRTETYAIRWNNRTTFLEQALAEQPRSVRLALQLAEEYRAQGRHEEAAEVARRAREITPEYWEIWTQSGQIAYDLGRYEEAAEYFKRAGEIRPSVKIGMWQGMTAEKLAATRPATQPAD